LKILLLSGYHATSHQYWCEGLMNAFPEHEWHCLTLPARYFNWRVRGAPLSWLHEQSAVLEQPVDLLIATSMVDLATLKGLSANLAITPSLCYFHENQFAYPKSREQHASVDAQMVNLYAALAADGVVFNSAFNRDSFFAGVNRLLTKLPDHRPTAIEPLLASRSVVLPVPLNTRVDANPLPAADAELVTHQDWQLDATRPTIKIIWASRWEYDKGPDRLLAVMEELERRGTEYRICILGEQFRHSPKEFAAIKQAFEHRIVQFGFVASTSHYQQWLASADIILSTSIHEFQGLAVLEAVAAGCVPVLPGRLAYPELVPAQFLYASHETDLPREAQAAADLIEQVIADRPKAPSVKGFFWSELRPAYAELIDRVANSKVR
jgi:glycosyltransferase involved in cell wall biosynthesis